MKMKDIADRLGISTSTAYKAFNGASDISNETRTAVMEMAAEMGYFGRKRKRLDKQVCVFIGHIEAVYTTNYAYEVAIAFIQAAAQHGYEVLIRGLSEDDGAGFNQIMSRFGFEGCLILGIDTETKAYSQIKNLTYPAVLVDNFVEGPKISNITMDNLNGMSALVNHLYELGHRNIGFIDAGATSMASRERFAGYLNTITLRGIPFNQDYVRNGMFSEYYGAQMAEELVTSHKEITAIACVSDLMAIGAIRRLQELGLRVPEDISITGFDDIRLSKYITPALTTMRANIKEIGFRAFVCLQDLIERDAVAAHVIEAPRLKIRSSTGPVR